MSINVRQIGKTKTLRKRTAAAIRSRVFAGEPCALCGRPIDLTLPQTYVDPKDGKVKRAPWSLEIDEIIPVSKGGLPYGANCQPSHRICNQRAGNKTKLTIKQKVSNQIETSENW